MVFIERLVNLQNNHITRIEQEAFAGSPPITHVYLNANRFTGNRVSILWIIHLIIGDLYRIGLWGFTEYFGNFFHTR